MSDNDTGITGLPPQDAFIETAEGLTAWRADFSSITVRRVFGGGRVLIVSDFGAQSKQFLLNDEQAAHLARLLGPIADHPTDLESGR